MKSIFKYQLERFSLVEKVSVTLPEEFKILSIQMQHDVITMWAEVNGESPVKHINFYIYTTGASIESDIKHISTVQDGSLFGIYTLICN